MAKGDCCRAVPSLLPAYVECQPNSISSCNNALQGLYLQIASIRSVSLNLHQHVFCYDALLLHMTGSCEPLSASLCDCMLPVAQFLKGKAPVSPWDP